MDNLPTYLNDHLGGAAGAIEHLDHLIESCEDPQLVAFLRSLRLEISVDYETLKKLIAEIGGKESTVRQAGAWIAEKLSRVKLGPEKPDQDFGLFMSLEGLALGIIGKGKLWTALAAAANDVPQLRGLDYAHLETRAKAQATQVESARIELARSVFGTKRAPQD